MRTLSKAKNQGMMLVPLSSGMLTWFSAFIPIDGEFVIGVERRIYRNLVSNFGGFRKEAKLSPSRPPPTPIDAVIDPEEVLLLQYIYSGANGNPFSFHLGIGTLLGASFGPSIPQLPLRNAMLAFAEFLLPSGRSFERLNIFYNRVYETLSVKNSSKIDEGDVFGALLISILVPVVTSSDLSFERVTFFHQYAMSAINHLIKKSESSVISTSMFWPAARLEVLFVLSVCVDVASSVELILQLYEGTRTSLGPQRFVALENPYSNLLQYEEIKRHPTIVGVASILMYAQLLLRCFRTAAERQSKDMFKVDPRMEILVSDLRADIFSPEFRWIRQILMDPRQGIAAPILFSLYQFCLLTLVLLNAKAVMTGLESPEGASAALCMFELLVPNFSNFPDNTSRKMALTMLTIGAFAFPFITGNNGNFT